MRPFAFNPVGFLVNLAIGWFALAFLQAALRGLLAGAGEGLMERFRAIAFWRDGSGAAVDAVLIVAIWVVANALWYFGREGR